MLTILLMILIMFWMPTIVCVQRSPEGHYLALSSQDGYCTLLEFEHDELGSPISLSGLASSFPFLSLLYQSSFPPRNCLVPFLSSFLIWRAVEETKVTGDENRDPVQKPEEMIIDVTKSDAAAESTTSEPGKNEGKLASPSSTSTPISNKPAKRRITPMAIDPWFPTLAFVNLGIVCLSRFHLFRFLY